MEASFQSGLIYRLKDLATGKLLLSVDPEDLPSQLLILDTTPPIWIVQDLDEGGRELGCDHIQTASGDKWLVSGPSEGQRGLDTPVLARTAKPVAEIRYIIPDATSPSIPWCGRAFSGWEVMNAPWTAWRSAIRKKMGVPLVTSSLWSRSFREKNNGWWLEGRDARIGPANVMVKGYAIPQAWAWCAGFRSPRPTPRCLDFAFALTRYHWEDAVDPYTAWPKKAPASCQ